MPQLSRRTEALIEKGNQSALGNALFKTFASQYSEENPEGVVNAGLAENVSRDPCCWCSSSVQLHRRLELTCFSNPRLYFNRGSNSSSSARWISRLQTSPMVSSRGQGIALAEPR